MTVTRTGAALLTVLGLASLLLSPGIAGAGERGPVVQGDRYGAEAQGEIDDAYAYRRTGGPESFQAQAYEAQGYQAQGYQRSVQDWDSGYRAATDGYGRDDGHWRDDRYGERRVDARGYAYEAGYTEETYAGPDEDWRDDYREDCRDDDRRAYAGDRDWRPEPCGDRRGVRDDRYDDRDREACGEIRLSNSFFYGATGGVGPDYIDGGGGGGGVVFAGAGSSASASAYASARASVGVSIRIGGRRGGGKPHGGGHPGKGGCGCGH